MLTGLDHIVILVPDLARATAAYQALGFVVIAGGKHGDVSHNALIGLEGGPYIELFAFLKPNPGHRWAHALRYGGGFVDMCLCTSDLDADIAAFVAAGAKMEPLRAMSRTRPDGVELHWRLSLPQRESSGVVPFLIQDITPLAARQPPAARHANSVRAIRAVRYALSDSDAAARFARILGQKGERIRRDALAAEGHAFKIGAVVVEALTPTASTGPLAAWLADHAPGPHSLVLEADTPPPAWSTGATSGVPIDVVRA